MLQLPTSNGKPTRLYADTFQILDEQEYRTYENGSIRGAGCV